MAKKVKTAAQKKKEADAKFKADALAEKKRKSKNLKSAERQGKAADRIGARGNKKLNESKGGGKKYAQGFAKNQTAKNMKAQSEKSKKSGGDYKPSKRKNSRVTTKDVKGKKR